MVYKAAHHIAGKYGCDFKTLPLLAGSSDGCIVGWFIGWLQFLCSSPYVSGVPDILSLRENCDLDANAFKIVPGPLFQITKLP